MRRIRTALALSMVLMVPVVGFASTCLAEEDSAPEILPLLLNQSEITDRALSGATGVIGVNMAAGDANAQANVRALVIGGEIAVAGAHVEQKTDEAAMSAMPSFQQDHIGGEAFSSGSGLIGVNQTAGYGNAQANLVTIGLGSAPQLASTAELGASHGGGEDTDQGYTGRRSDIIDGHAFSGSQGVIQVNQSAGSANQVTNSIGVNCRAMEIR